ncbi:MAG: hypothetical protein ACRD37_02870, partial [Candidatus Acidiferrales bacterium]
MTLAIVAMISMAAAVSADTLEMKNGSVIHGKYMGGSQFNVRLMVNDKTNYYATKDILTLSFDATYSGVPAAAAHNVAPVPAVAAHQTTSASAVPPATNLPDANSAAIPAGTIITVRMIDTVDSATNQVGDQFHASLESDLVSNGVV